MSPAEEIKSKLDIVEVIREYIQVKAAGVNFQALCPFHREKSPSFVISPDKQIWHCFGCGKGGDVLSFVQEMEGLSFPDTLRLLAPKAGVVLRQESNPEYSKRGRLLDCLESAAKQYVHYLETDAIGQKMKAYLLKRGLSEKTIKEWQVGYGPEQWTALLDYLRSQKFTDQEIFAAGLAGRSERGSAYDRFRDRIVFPIRDVSGALIAFTARVNPDKADTVPGGKYINSPQTEVYDKSRVLFALDKAKKAIKERGFAIVVEGQMDAIACHQHGFTNTVASSGTALTVEQLKLLKRFSNNLILSFDMDSAGQLAADRGIKEAMALDMNIKIIVLPSQYKDPDECLRANPEDFKQALINSRPMMEYYFEKVKSGKDLRKLSDKKEVAGAMLAMIAKFSNKIDRDYWLQRLAENLGISEQALRESLPALKSGKPDLAASLAPAPAAPVLGLNREERLSEILLALLLKSPDFITYSASHLEPDDLSGETLISFYKNLIIYYNKFAVLDYDSFRLYLQEQADGSAEVIDRLALLGEKDYYQHDANQLKTEITQVLLELKRFSLKRKIKSLQDQISAAEAGGESEGMAMLMAEIKNLTEQLNSLRSL
ncbi:MAG: DNA primase [Patescibacteria group bacterium]|nr:DNA primase [Patescibacteria group bacterium]